MIKLIRYEFRNLLGNFFGVFFGLIFPVLMTYIIFPAVIKEAPAIALDQVKVQLFMTNILMVPLALLLVGFSALFSQELERDVMTRLSLFSIPVTKQMIAKMIVQLTSVLFSLLFYTLATSPIVILPKTTLNVILVYTIALIVLSVIIFMLSFGISLLARRFSVAFGITMTLYFTIMILSGMMGIPLESLPDIVQAIARYLPTDVLLIIFQLIGLIRA